MDVILTQDIPSVGAQGTVVAVKDGYARNYLLPRGLARQATAANKQVIERLRQQAAAKVETLRRQAQAQAEQLAALSCTIPAPVGEQEEKLHGSVTAADIAQALAAQGITVEKRQILLEAPFTKLGVYRVPVKLHPEVTATLTVWIVKA